MKYAIASWSKIASHVAIIGVNVALLNSAASPYFFFFLSLAEFIRVSMFVEEYEGASAFKMQISNNASL